MQHGQDRMRLEVQDDVGAWLHADKSRLVALSLWGRCRLEASARRSRYGWRIRTGVRSGQVRAPAGRGAVFARAWKYNVQQPRQSHARAHMPLCV
jgi:hypothetical protein